jgi:acyl-CoA thioesterase-1
MAAMASRARGRSTSIVFAVAAVVPLLVAFAACGGGRTAEPEPTTHTTTAAPDDEHRDAAVAGGRVVFLGDSLTAGLGLRREQAVPALIQERLRAAGYDYQVVNAGVSGDTSAGGLSRLDWSLEGDVKILVVELGANDGLRGLPVDQMKRNLGEIVRRARARGITVVLTGMEAPPNYGPAYTAEFRQAFRDLADEHDVIFVPFFLEGVAGIESLNNPDGIHPNAAGAKIVADTVWSALAPILEQSAP